MFELVVVVHFAFIAWVVTGGLLVIRWWWLAAVHVPALVWAVLLEWRGWICPLTALEQALRPQQGLPVYHTGFVEAYLLPIIYPQGLTRADQLAIAAALVLANGLLYGLVIHRHWRKRKRGGIWSTM